MWYETEKLKQMALQAIAENGLIFIQEAVAYMPCNSATFYNHKLHEDEDVQDLINANRVKIKVKSRNKWEESDNATLQLALYKLVSDEDELRRLSVLKNEIAGNEGKAIEIKNTLNLDNLSLDELRELERIAKLAGNTKEDSKEGL
jgi:hypothetical protein